MYFDEKQVENIKKCYVVAVSFCKKETNYTAKRILNLD